MSLQQLLEGLEKYASLREDTDRILRMSSDTNPRYNPRNLTTMITTGKSPTRPCVFCDGNHFMDKCHKVTDPVQRFRIFRVKKLCTNCTSTKHGYKQCPSKKRCWGKPRVPCNGNHHTSLHDFFDNTRNTRSGGSSDRQQHPGNNGNNNGNNNASNRPPQNSPNPQ